MTPRLLTPCAGPISSGRDSGRSWGHLDGRGRGQDASAEPHNAVTWVDLDRGDRGVGQHGSAADGSGPETDAKRRRLPSRSRIPDSSAACETKVVATVAAAAPSAAQWGPTMTGSAPSTTRSLLRAGPMRSGRTSGRAQASRRSLRGTTGRCRPAARAGATRLPRRCHGRSQARRSFWPDSGELARCRPDRPQGAVVPTVQDARASGNPAAVSDPRHAFIRCASWKVRRTVSPILPMPWESLFTIEIAPSSCSGPSAAIVVARARSLAASRPLRQRDCRRERQGSSRHAPRRPPSRTGWSAWWTSSMMLGSATRPRTSGMWPPPAPSTW